jgi:hypothetical protein
MTLIIVSMVAQIAAIAMAGFIKRMSDIPSPDVLQAPLRAIRPNREDPGWHGGAADQPSFFPAPGSSKRQRLPSVCAADALAERD